MRYLVFAALFLIWFAGCSDPAATRAKDTVEDICRWDEVDCEGGVHISGLHRQAPVNETAIRFDSLEGSVLIEDAELVAAGNVVLLNASACDACILTIRNTTLQVQAGPEGVPPGAALQVLGFQEVHLINVTINVPNGGSGVWDPPYRIITEGYGAVATEGDLKLLRVQDVVIRSNGTSGTAIDHQGGAIDKMDIGGLDVEGFGGGIVAEASDVMLDGVQVTCVEGDYTIGTLLRASTSTLNDVALDGCHEGLRVSGVDSMGAQRVQIAGGALGADLRAAGGVGPASAQLDKVSFVGQGLIGIRTFGVELQIRNSTFDGTGSKWTAAEGPAESHGAIVLANAGGSARDSHFSQTRPYAVAYAAGGLLFNAVAEQSFHATGNEWAGPNPTLMPVGVPDAAMELAPGNHFTEGVVVLP